MLALQSAIDVVPQRASRARYGTRGFPSALTFVLYPDRTCIGKAAPFMQQDLSLTDRQMGYVHAAFTISYAAFEVLVGHWDDKHGSRPRVNDRWFLAAARGRMTGFINMPALPAGMVAPIGTASLIEAIGWRRAFTIYGSLGLVGRPIRTADPGRGGRRRPPTRSADPSCAASPGNNPHEPIRTRHRPSRDARPGLAWPPRLLGGC